MNVQTITSTIKTAQARIAAANRKAREAEKAADAVGEAADREMLALLKAIKEAEFELLTRAYERARDTEAASSQRANALAVDLAAARAALESEQSRSRDLDRALADPVMGAVRETFAEDW